MMVGEIIPFLIENILLVVLEKEQVPSLLSCMSKIVLKILKSKFLDKFPQKLNIFSLNLQSSLSLPEIRHNKTKKTSL